MGFRALEVEENRGRPKRLEMEPYLIDEICGYLESGMFVREAAALSGVAHDSVYKWLKQGSRDIKNEINSPEAQFADAVKTAMAKAELDSLNHVRNAAQLPQFWAAGAWFLERRYPEKYGRKDRVAMEHSGQMAMGVASIDKPLSERLSDEDKRKAAQEIARSLAIIGKPDDGSERRADSYGESGDEWESPDSQAFRVSEFETD